LQRVEEDEDQQQPDPEIGKRPGEHAVDEDQAVGDAAAVHGDGDAERNADQHREQDRADDELQRRGQALLDIEQDRLRGSPRHAEIAGQDALQVVRVLRDERLVEPELATDLGDALDRRVGPGEDVGRIAGKQPDEEEDDHRHGEQLRHGEEQPLAGEAEERLHAIDARVTASGRPTPRSGRTP
jgi:hypothetical protein